MPMRRSSVSKLSEAVRPLWAHHFRLSRNTVTRSLSGIIGISTTSKEKAAAMEDGPKYLGLNTGPVKGFILDITGVLYNSGGEDSDGVAIPGSIDAVKRLYAESNVRFLSNESTSTTSALTAKLRRIGFPIQDGHVITPAPVLAAYLRAHRLRPHLLVHKDIKEVFSDIDQADPNCVVIGDAEHDFTFENVNEAFRILMGLDRKLLFSLGNGKFYQKLDGPTIDVGAFAAALKYATDCQQIVFGKPSAEYFDYSIKEMRLQKHEVVMVGDDIQSDCGGAMRHGIRAIQVRTGKWRPEWEFHSIRPSLTADDLNTAVDTVFTVCNGITVPPAPRSEVESDDPESDRTLEAELPN